MPWLKLILETTDANVPLLEDCLIELGAAAVTLTDSADQPLFEPPLGTTPLWSQTRIEGLFDTSVDMDVATNVLKHYFNSELPNASLNYKIEALEDKDWEKVWMDDFKPMCFGTRLWICPSWIQTPEDNAVNLKLDPGLAFGTGTHPTTAMCLEWLDSQALDGTHVIDYGCGSGVLGIAAGLLGSEQVIAIDNDPQALIASKDNCIKNQLQDKFHTFSPEQFQQHLHNKASVLPFTEADVLIANILAGPLQQLAATLTALVKPGGKLVLSGILDYQAEEVMAAYASHWHFYPPQHKAEWCRLEAQRKAKIDV